MNDNIKELLDEIEAMKVKLVAEIEAHEKHISYEIHNGYVRFEKEVINQQKENMKNLLAWFRDIPLLHLFTSPLVYGMIVPAIFLDMILFLYQQVLFRVFKFKFIKRSDYIRFDRQYLGYLNVFEKLNCVYCSYFNGLMQYASAIASRTELYFCPIKHAKKVAYEHEHYKNFFQYGDEEEYQKKLEALRKQFEESKNQ